MAQITGKYETVFIVKPNLTEEETNAVIEKFKTLISDNGTLGDVDVWGSRKLAYPIDDYTEGYYVLVNFESKPELPAELDRNFRINDSVIRSIIVAKEE